MGISVDIADRLYDYTDEEVAARVIADFQSERSLGDEEIVALWSDENDSRRALLESLIIKAVDANGSVKRAQENIPANISISVDKF